MIKVKIGQMIYDVRAEMKITQEDLCMGLCTVSTLSKYESGTRFPDSLLFHMFMQRLGKSPGRISIMVSEQEADYFEWKKKTLDAVKAQQWEKVRLLREEGHKKNALINEPLQKQYELYLDSIIYDKLENDLEKSYECIRQAIGLTIADIDHWDGKKGLLSADEMNMAFLYLRDGKKLGIRSSSEIKERFAAFDKYIETRVDDAFEKSKLYPRMVCAQILLLHDEMDVRERIWIEEKALKLLKRTQEIYDMPEILRLLIADYREIGDLKAAVYEKQRETLVSVMNEYGTPYHFYLESWYDSNEQICLMNEYLYAGRKQKKLTQEVLSEGICAVETYSRIESGKRAPSTKNYLELAERLDINWGYYRGQIVTEHFKDFELMTEQRFETIDGKLDKAEELLWALRTRLDLQEVENLQYIEFMELVIKKKKDELSEKDLVSEYNKILGYSIKNIEETERFFTKTEIEIIVQLAFAYRSMKEYDKAIAILESVVKNNSRRKFEIWQEMGVLKRLLAGVYLDIGDWERGRKKILGLLKEMIEKQSMQMMAETLYILAWSMELACDEDKKVRADLYAKAFYLSDLVEMEQFKKIYKEKYEKEFQTDMQWY